jgi:hypothetical protein
MKRRKKTAPPYPLSPVSLPRREFALEIALLALAGAAVTVSACGGGGSSPSGSTPPPAAGDEVGSISDNHGHSAVITAARLAQGAEYDLDIRGSSGHPHTVRLTAADLAQVSSGARVGKVSSNDDGHTHQVTFN